VIVVVGVYFTLIATGLGCSTDEDCSLLGVCTKHVCECDSGWKGDDCGILNLEPAVYGSGYNLTGSTPPTDSWGANIFPTTGSSSPSDWSMVVAEFENHCQISNWSPNSAIVLAQSTTGPEGPYSRKKVLVAPFAHNPKVVKAPDGTWLMYTIGVHVGSSKLVNCSATTNLDQEEGDREAEAETPTHPPGRNPENLESNITLFTSASPEGPWARYGVVLGADYLKSWDEDTSNPSPWVLPNGTILLMYRGCVVAECHSKICGCTGEYIGISSAPSWKGPYTRLKNTTILPTAPAEDPSMWIDNRNNVHFLMHYLLDGNVLVARHAFARHYEGPWSIHSNTIPYNSTVPFSDGSVVTYHKRERPHLVFDEDNIASYLITGAVLPVSSSCKGYCGGSFTLIQRIKHE